MGVTFQLEPWQERMLEAMERVGRGERLRLVHGRRRTYVAWDPAVEPPSRAAPAPIEEVEVDPRTGDVFRLRDGLVDVGVGEQIPIQELRMRIANLGADATDDELAAIRAEQLVAISEEAATRLKLGERERERRRRRRKAAKRARRANR